jgi:murein DD-endopeptidase MepM/ murein hydrolase activator NlpD
VDGSSLLVPLNQIPTDLITQPGSGLESKIRAAQQASADKQKGELKKASEQFEAIFLAYLLKVMRETIEESGLTEGGFGKSIYTELFDQEISVNMARRGALGISDMLYRDLSARALNNGQTGEAESKDPPQKDPGALQSPGISDGSAIPVSAPGSSEPDISDLQLPVRAPISSEFGSRRDPFSHQVRFHKGVDLAAPEGMKVVAALPGTVISAGYQSGYGNSVLIQHADGLQTRYCHLQKVNVKAGDVVTSEEVVGTVGNTGRSTGPHLHFEVIRMGKQVDPASEFGFQIADLPRGSSKTGS